MGTIVFPAASGGIPPEIIALIGVLASSLIGGVVAFWVSARKNAADQKATAAKLAIEREAIHRETVALKAQRKLEIAHKYAELASESQEVADGFLHEIAKQTAIGFLYWESGPEKAKIWIRDDANILIGRHDSSDIVVSDPYVSRQHMFIHSSDNNVSILPINPTNKIIVDGVDIDAPTRLTHMNEILIGETQLFYFSLHHQHAAAPTDDPTHDI